MEPPTIDRSTAKVPYRGRPSSICSLENGQSGDSGRGPSAGCTALGIRSSVATTATLRPIHHPRHSPHPQNIRPHTITQRPETGDPNMPAHHPTTQSGTTWITQDLPGTTVAKTALIQTNLDKSGQIRTTTTDQDLPNPTTSNRPQIHETQCFLRPDARFFSADPAENFSTNHPASRSARTEPNGPMARSTRRSPPPDRESPRTDPRPAPSARPRSRRPAPSPAPRWNRGPRR